jgi:hypothetical protein
MTTGEAMGHVAIMTFAGSLGLFFGATGVLIGVCLLIGWILYSSNH